MWWRFLLASAPVTCFDCRKNASRTSMDTEKSFFSGAQQQRDQALSHIFSAKPQISELRLCWSAQLLGECSVSVLQQWGCQYPQGSSGDRFLLLPTPSSLNLVLSPDWSPVVCSLQPSPTAGISCTICAQLDLLWGAKGKREIT